MAVGGCDGLGVGEVGAGVGDGGAGFGGGAGIGADVVASTPMAVKTSGLPVPAVAVTLLLPALGPRISFVAACPAASVTAWVTERVPPPVVTEKTTDTACAGCPWLSVTFNTNGLGRTFPTVPV